MVSVQFRDSDILKNELVIFCQQLNLDIDWFKRLGNHFLDFIIGLLNNQTEINTDIIDQLKVMEPGSASKIDNVLNSKMQSHLEQSISLFKINLPVVFDKIFKDLQALIKSCSYNSLWLGEKHSDLNNVDNRLSNIALPQSNLRCLLEPFHSSVKSKVGIISTMFNNQRRTSLSNHCSVSNFYSLVRYLDIPLIRSNLDDFVHEFVTVPVLKEWYSCVEECFRNSEKLYGQAFAVCFISDLFLSANVSQRHRHEILNHLAVRITQPSLLHFGILSLSEPIPYIDPADLK
jgi:hypothetical protein